MRRRVFVDKMVLEQDRIEIVLIIGDGYKTQREAVTIFNERHPDRPVSKTAVHKIIRKFKKTEVLLMQNGAVGQELPQMRQTKFTLSRYFSVVRSNQRGRLQPKPT